ncbi:arginase family protein [Neobacillus piezotolerans]|uniref:arginase family protein n=1 Tax=Neobacillus piezotolerans TaxID=2259171 RepID=UPI0015F16AED|nr:arginase family protein [Neobacillus piezotolerans]
MKIIVAGIPSCAGGLHPGTELAPDALRKTNLLPSLLKMDCTVVDRGNLLQGKMLARHNIPPVRNWPAPREVWDEIVETKETIFEKDAFSVILGGDCSIVVGAFTAFQQMFGENTYLIVVDGHLDTVAPQANRCIGAAGMGLWFLTQDTHVWWTGNRIPAGRIKAIGTHTPGEQLGIEHIPYEKFHTEEGIEELSRILVSIPEDAGILVHFDVDVLHESIMPAAYSPSSTGLDFKTASVLFSVLLRDTRVKGIEITEFAAGMEGAAKSAETIADLLIKGLNARKTISASGEYV